MKTKVLIIEDNLYKGFTLKQLLESQLKVQVQSLDVETPREMVEATARLEPDVIVFRPSGGVAELLSKMKKRRTNRRNTEITLLLMPEVDDALMRRLESHMATPSRKLADAA